MNTTPRHRPAASFASLFACLHFTLVVITVFAVIASAKVDAQSRESQSADNPAAKQTVSTLYTRAQGAYLAGESDEAATLFQQVLAAQPQHEGARNYLRMIAAERRLPGSGGSLERRLSGVVLPEVKFRDASLSSAIEFLRQATERATDGALKPNFILQLPPGYADSMFITMEVSNMPFPEALRYVCRLGGVQFTIEDHGILVEQIPQAGGS